MAAVILSFLAQPVWLLEPTSHYNSHNPLPWRPARNTERIDGNFQQTMPTNSITCGHCGQVVDATSLAAGQTVVCPYCGGLISGPSAWPGEGESLPEENLSNEPPPPSVMLAPADWPTASADIAPAQTPLPDWVAAQMSKSAPAPTSSRTRTTTEPTPTRGNWSGLVLSLLVPYAVTMTLMAGWLYFQKREQAEADHPLANIPDILGEYEPARRMQLGRRLDRLPPVDAPLPPGLLVRLGETLAIGDLEVTPESVEQRRLEIRTVFHNGEMTSTRPDRDALVLHLRLRNRSSDVWFHPTDPAFDRKYQPRRGVPKPYTQLIANGYHAYGGPIEWRGQPGRPLARRVFVVGQEHDDQPLGPGQERRTVICTDPTDEQVLRSVQAHQGPEPIVWRVMLRRGLVPFDGREWSVCAVVGVPFVADDVRVHRP